MCSPPIFFILTSLPPSWRHPPPHSPSSSRALPWRRRRPSAPSSSLVPHPPMAAAAGPPPNPPSSHALHPPPAPSRSGGGGRGLGGGHGGWIHAGHGGSAAAGDLNPQGAADLRAGQRPPHLASCPAAVRRGRLPSGPGQWPNPVAPLPDPPPPPLPDLVGALLSRLASPGSWPSSPVCGCRQPVTFWCSVGLPYQQCSVACWCGVGARLPLVPRRRGQRTRSPSGQRSRRSSAARRAGGQSQRPARGTGAHAACSRLSTQRRSRSTAAAGPIRFESSLCTCHLIPAHLFKLIDGHKLQGLRNLWFGKLQDIDGRGLMKVCIHVFLTRRT